MKICITAQGETLDAPVDPRFGRCQFFIIVDTELSSHEALLNPNKDAAGGAGIQSAQLVGSKSVQVVVTGNVGPNAFSTLQAAGIEVCIGATGTVNDVLEKYHQGKLGSASGPSVGNKGGL